MKAVETNTKKDKTELPTSKGQNDYSDLLPSAGAFSPGITGIGAGAAGTESAGGGGGTSSSVGLGEQKQGLASSQLQFFVRFRPPQPGLGM